MRTARLLTVSEHALPGGGGVCPGGCLPGEVVCPGGVSQHAMGQTPPSVDRQTCVKT